MHPDVKLTPKGLTGGQVLGSVWLDLALALGAVWQG